MEELKLQFDVPDAPEAKVKLVGVQVAVSPVTGETVLDRVNVPVNPLRLVSVTVEVPVDPAGNVTTVGLAMMLKSGGAITVIGMLTVCVSEPLIPVIVTV